MTHTTGRVFQLANLHGTTDVSPSYLPSSKNLFPTQIQNHQSSWLWWGQFLALLLLLSCQPAIGQSCNCVNGVGATAAAVPSCSRGTAVNYCASCVSGYYLKDGMCKLNQCSCVGGVEASGPSCPQDKGKKCASCPAGTMYVTSTIRCSTCPSGQTQLNSHQLLTSCTSCEPGKYASSAISPCTSCGAGKYQLNSTNPAYSCKTCSEGKAAPAADSGGCIDCIRGMYQDATPSTRYNCTYCAPGYYATSSGQSNCDESCGAGKYSDGVAGQKTCTNCSIGFYLPRDIISQNDASGKNSWCLKCEKAKEEGSQHCSSCPGKGLQIYGLFWFRTMEGLLELQITWITNRFFFFMDCSGFF